MARPVVKLLLLLLLLLLIPFLLPFHTVRHGFPYQPTAIAFDPIQRILAVGTKQGSIRIIGRPGVDVHVKHEGDPAVVCLAFLINEGGLVSATGDDSLHLWNIQQKTPQIVHSLKFQRERITTLHLPFQSRWLYLGTERGNIHIVNIESFTLSGYTINWNKAIELSRKTHPGAVVHLSDCPVEPGKLLIGYESGQLVLWDFKGRTAEVRYHSAEPLRSRKIHPGAVVHLSDCPVEPGKLLIGYESGQLVLWDFKGRTAEVRYHSAEPLRSVSWHHEGKQFMCCHTDGSLTTWTLKQNSNRPTSHVFPHEC
ncbi:syntaxin-binding protein 5-like [Eriocheir sinensis]|uniref:syntaxin-binding protein 5-like n=1 Tax=Eriocheir sinensis TaxID=95602 RepID=UPI0021CA0156|nr:syntaxin-binding protein 5-like [Eriocheir sinensis]